MTKALLWAAGGTGFTFLMTAADWEVRVLANYLTLGWALVFTVSATRALLLEGRREEKATHKTAHAAA